MLSFKKMTSSKAIYNSDWFLVMNGNQRVGEISLINNESDVYISFLGIDKEFRRQGFATKVIEWVQETYQKPIAFYIAHGQSAEAFWQGYIEKGIAIQRKERVFEIPYEEKEIEQEKEIEL